MYTHSDEPQFACDKCENKKFWNKTQLYRHKVSVHEDRKKDYICTYCGKVFDCSGRLKRHSSIVHEGIKKFKCKLCPQAAYGQSHELKKHLTNFHKKIIPKNYNINNVLNEIGELSNADEKTEDFQK